MDVVGIGVGPFNLSLAALLKPIKNLNAIFFESRDNFNWHPGLLLPDAEIQVSHLKDLVTLVDPTSPYSFIAYLSKHKRLYRFINADFTHVLRHEFNDYLRWVSASLNNLNFGEPVLGVNYDGNQFIVQTSKQSIQSQHLVLGHGLIPNIPLCARNYLGANVFHSGDYLKYADKIKNKRVAVIGGGQSAAEVVLHLLEYNTPSQINWISSRSNILPIDDSAFTNELYSPKYIEYFHKLSKERRKQLLQDQVLTSDGISPHLIKAIYQKLYVLEHVIKKNLIFNIHPNTRLVNLNDGFELILSNQKSLPADIIILCTGYQWQFPAILNNLKSRIPLDNERFIINKDYSICWDANTNNRIYVQNAAQHSHGIADRNLSLMAFRSATIINSIAQKNIYDISDESVAIDWQQSSFMQSNDRRFVSNA